MSLTAQPVVPQPVQDKLPLARPLRYKLPLVKTATAQLTIHAALKLAVRKA